MSERLLIGLLMAVSAGAALLLTGLLSGSARKFGLFDRHSERSAHTEPTPRLGGVAIVSIALLGFCAAGIWFGLPARQAIALVGGGLIVAAAGMIDDLRHLRASIRLMAHVGAAIWAVYWIGPLDLGFMPFWDGSWTGAAMVVTVLAVVWMINLYNFMDGINGLAATETVGVALPGAVLLGIAGAGQAALIPPIVLAAACLGFLPWNFPRARTFMGDASSGFLGFSLAAMAIIASQVDSAAGLGWFILAGVFIVDASVTVARRLLRGEKVYEAHSEHAYQRLARRLRSHLPVTLGAVGVTWLWLFPLAWVATARLVDPIVVACVAILPLVALAVWVGAGRPRGQAIDGSAAPAQWVSGDQSKMR